MIPLGEVIGAVMSDLIHARRIADITVLETAEFYQSEELLRGLTIPRMRLADVVIDVPVIVRMFDDDRRSIHVITDTEQIKELSSSASVTRLKLTLKEEGVEWHQIEDEDGRRQFRLVPE